MEKLRINFEANLFSRNKISKLIEGLNLEQVNKIPKGLKHNIVWNIGHILAMQQLVIYMASEVEPTFKMNLIEKYKTGSVANSDVTEMEFEYLKEQLTATLINLKKNYKAGVFKKYNAFKTKAGVSVNCVEDAISFHTFHEGIHLGKIMEIRKLL